MWWRFLTFCVLVSLVLFVVLSCIHGRPVIHLFFHRCCEDDIENDQVIFENFGNNFLRERLVGADIVVDDNDSFVSEFEVEEVIKRMRDKLNVHDPKSRVDLEVLHTNNTGDNDNRNSNVSSEKVKGLQTESDLEVTEDNFNDVSSESREVIKEGKLSSNNDVLSELNSDESVEATTENNKAKTNLPVKIIQLKNDFNKTDMISTVDSVSVDIKKSEIK
ncbi:uncharacterized protein LOC126377408 [Pectinophora gossypiella]|uniref:uncharacterized protein LOC126377408 n=1 Tax=Pectinophora gossypiella TaxID=13191 RepID=UPI00214E48CD|nr:uncharacterized protein LOC126377408 [Pectinophora gossypiella]